jgi:hypothetical protein
MLSCSCVLPDGWVNVPVPDDTYDFDNPAVFLPLVVCMAPYGAVVFTIAARPAFDDGTVQDWAEYLAAQNNLQVERIREARVNRMPCILVDAIMPSDAGVMRSRSVFLEDGRRLYNVGTLAPEAIWPSVEADFEWLLGSFKLDEVQGITAVPLKLMTPEPAVNLSAAAEEAEREARKPVAAERVAGPDEPVWTYAEDPPEPVVDPNDPQPQDPEFAGQPDWWRTAVLHERGDRLEEAEQAILGAVDHIGAYSSVAYLYEQRLARLIREGKPDADAKAARDKAIQWLHTYAGSATSGGEGAALSLERDQRIAALGG